MKLKHLFLLYLLSLGGFTISTWVLFNPMWIEIFSVALVLITAAALPELYLVAKYLFFQSTRFILVVRLFLRALAAAAFAIGCAMGWHHGIWGSLEVQPIALSIAIISTGGLMLIGHYWENYLR